MRACYHIEILTPKKVVLNGLWFGPKKAKRVIIFIHGLTGSLFSMRQMVDELVDRDTAVITFNNRGFEQVSTIKHHRGNGTEYAQGGTAHEVFTDCVDDIEGVVRFARKVRIKDVYLMGHSTGAQKAIYWAAKNGRGVKGIVLLGPLSDFADSLMPAHRRRIAAGLKIARSLVRAGNPHALLPEKYTGWFACDAQRFVSLYAKESSEEIFTYASGKNPTTFAKVATPILAVFAGADEYADRPAGEIADWFLEHIYTGETVIVPKVGHSFKGAEKMVARQMKDWIIRT